MCYLWSHSWLWLVWALEPTCSTPATRCDPRKTESFPWRLWFRSHGMLRVIGEDYLEIDTSGRKHFVGRTYYQYVKFSSHGRHNCDETFLKNVRAEGVLTLFVGCFSDKLQWFPGDLFEKVVLVGMSPKWPRRVGGPWLTAHFRRGSVG